jgi:hypothetical protein
MNSSKPPGKPGEETSPNEPSLDHIMRIGAGFWASKTLLSATELGLFTELALRPLDAETLRRQLGLHPRSACDFFDALVALGLIERRDGKYFNTPETACYLDRNRPGYAGGILEMWNARLYGFWGSLTEALRTGAPQNESKTGGDVFTLLYSDPNKLETFLKSMTGLSLRTSQIIAEKFPWQFHQTFADIGTAQGATAVQVARAHPHLRGIGLDLPPVQPIFDDYVAVQGLEKRVRFQAGDFLRDALPEVDVLIMGHILHMLNLEQKRMLIEKAYDALPKDGALIVYEALIDDERCVNVMGLLMSLTMLIETPGGFDFTGADCQGWMRKAGFQDTRVVHLAGPHSIVVGLK